MLVFPWIKTASIGEINQNINKIPDSIGFKLDLLFDQFKMSKKKKKKVMA